jgi:hypothetical protein
MSYGAAMLLIGAVPFRLTDGATVLVSDAAGARALVVNDSPNLARFETFRYGSSSSGLGSGMTSIAPYGVGHIEHRPDYFGPYDRPPGSVKVSHRMSSAVKDWLTW